MACGQAVDKAGSIARLAHDGCPMMKNIYFGADRTQGR
jgi:hypothetical protein